MQRLCSEVLEVELGGKQWRGEDEAILAVAITNAITARVMGACRRCWRVGHRMAGEGAPPARRVDCAQARHLSLPPARSCISPAALELDRYKIMAQVFLGENRQQGVRVMSRCLWDPEVDTFASYSYKNVRRGGGWGEVPSCAGVCAVCWIILQNNEGEDCCR